MSVVFLGFCFFFEVVEIFDDVVWVLGCVGFVDIVVMEDELMVGVLSEFGWDVFF